MSVQTIHCNTRGEVLQTLAAHPQAHVFGGGTLIMRAVNDADPRYSTLVRITDPQLQQVRVEGDQLVIGSAVTMSRLMASRDATFLHAVARRVGGPAVRNMATVGGNLYAESPYGDLTTALLAMDAELTVEGQPQRLPLDQFLAQRGVPGSAMLVVDVRCKRPATTADFRFHKVSRVKPKGISVLSIAAHLPGSSASAMQGVRIAYGAMAGTPVRVPGVEQSLEGRRLDAPTIEAAVARAVEGLTPPTDAIASSWYRAQVAPVHLRRVLESGGHQP